MQNIRVLVVDDELEIAELLKDYLEREQYEVIIATDGISCLKLFREQVPQLVILDIMLPGMDGMELCRMIRAESAVPVIMLSAKQAEVDKILSLGLGADDYVVKPFSPGEMVARVKAQLRRYRHLSAPVPQEETMAFGQLILYPKAYSVKLSGEEVRLATKEFEVLRCLAQHANQVLTRQQIYEQVWGMGEYGDLNTVTIHIKRIREKIERNPADPRYIQTVRGVGYKWGGGGI